MDPAIELLIASCASLLAGFVDAVAGGGGLITFPALMLMGLPISTVVGTNKLVGTAGSSMSAYTFIRRKQVNPELLTFGFPLACCGAVFGAYLVLQIPNEFLKPFIGVFLLLLALYFFLRPKMGIENNYSSLGRNSKYVFLSFVFFFGFYDGFFGPGTGMFLTFIFIRFLKLDFVKAAGNTKVLNFASNIASLLFFIAFGTVNFELGIPMAVCNLVGGRLGANYAIKRGSGFVRWIFLIMSLLLAAKLLRDYIV